MRPLLGLSLLAFAVAAPLAHAEPGGCLKYGAAGAVGGHLVNHGVLGAVGGCATGMYKRHEFRKEAREKAALYDKEHPAPRVAMKKKPPPMTSSIRPSPVSRRLRTRLQRRTDRGLRPSLRSALTWYSASEGGPVGFVATAKVTHCISCQNMTIRAGLPSQARTTDSHVRHHPYQMRPDVVGARLDRHRPARFPSRR